ncbi:MAG: hypothetical protein ACO4AJ_09135, partial [Prochlorothrix sp.]
MSGMILGFISRVLWQLPHGEGHGQTLAPAHRLTALGTMLPHSATDRPTSRIHHCGSQPPSPWI